MTTALRNMRAHDRVQVLLQHPALLLALIIVVALLPRLVLMPMAGHLLDLEQHYDAAQYIIDHGMLKMYDAPVGVNHPPVGVGLYAGSAWAWAELGGGFNGPFDRDNGAEITALKVPKLAFEIALIALIYAVVFHYAGVAWAAFTALLFAFSPGHLAVTAGIGQSDSIFCFFLALALYLLKERHPRWAWAAYALAWLSKFQSILLLPIMLVFTWRRYGWRMTITTGIMFVAIIALGMTPFYLTSGDNALVPYGQGSVDLFPYITSGAYNFWFWVTGADGTTSTLDTTELAAGITYFQAGMLLFALATALICARVWLLPERDDEFLVAAVAGVAFFMLPTQIHARYLYPGLMFLIITLWRHPWLIAVCLGFMLTLTQNIFDRMHLGSGLLYYPSKLLIWDNSLSALANTLLFALLLVILLWPLWRARGEIPARVRDSLRLGPSRYWT